MQVSEVLLGDPGYLKTLLEGIAAGSELQILEKTTWGGRFIVVYDDSGTASQSIEVLRGDPTDIAAAINDLISGGAVIDILCRTFSAGFYVVVYR